MVNDVNGIVLDQCQCGTVLFHHPSRRSIYASDADQLSIWKWIVVHVLTSDNNSRDVVFAPKEFEEIVTIT